MICIPGLIAAKAAVMAGRRPVHEVLLQRGRERDALPFARRVEDMGLSLRWVDGEELAQIAGEGHGGAAVWVGPARPWGLDEILGKSRLVLLHGVEDPYNLGHALRSLWAAGVEGVILPPRDWSAVEGVIARASAGASEWMPLLQADPEGVVRAAKGRGFGFLTTGRDKGAASLYDTPLTPPLLLAVGGEKRGLNRGVMALADGVLEIPYGRDYPYALTADGAAAVVAFEWLRQIRQGDP